MAVKELNLTIKENWTEKNLGLIALTFGYLPDDNFAKALESFIRNIVEPARVTQFLGIIAQKYFSSWQPPLVRLNSQNSHADNLFSPCQNRK
jgi:hypothetical protein